MQTKNEADDLKKRIIRLYKQEFRQDSLKD